MQYLCLIRREWPAGPATEARRALDEELRQFVGELRHAGHFLAGAALGPPADGVRVRWRGAPAVTPLAAADPVSAIAGFVLLEARDLNHAIQLAARHPAARLGTVEIHPVRGESRLQSSALG